jgi:heparanase 1
MPGKSIWITETSESSCGGDPWAKTFLDSFRYLDQLGRLARHGIASVMHNTLAVSEYSLIDRQTMKPRPNYWAALLWRRLMGSTVLDAGPSSEGFHVYSQCLPGQRGGVSILAINTSRAAPRTLNLPLPAERYTLSAQNLDATTVELNGTTVAMQGNGELPGLQGQRIPAGEVAVAPVTITFLAVPTAANPSCQ